MYDCVEENESLLSLSPTMQIEKKEFPTMSLKAFHLETSIPVQSKYIRHFGFTLIGSGLTIHIVLLKTSTTEVLDHQLSH